MVWVWYVDMNEHDSSFDEESEEDDDDDFNGDQDMQQDDERLYSKKTDLMYILNDMDLMDGDEDEDEEEEEEGEDGDEYEDENEDIYAKYGISKEGGKHTRKQI